jgi:multidrug resistance efflux pump
MNRWQKLTTVLLLAALVLVPFGLVGFAVTGDLPSVAAQPVTPSGARWTAAAPGRVEPQGGEYRLAAAAPGRIVDVAAAVGDKVMRGDMLVRLDDREIVARLAGVAADVASKKSLRDDESADDAAKLRYAAEDDLFAAEQRLADARQALDRLLVERRNGGGQADAIAAARTKWQATETDLARARRFAAERLGQGASERNTAEAALIVARSQWSALQAMRDQLAVRAPIDGTVMASTAKTGEIAGSSAVDPLMTVGDLSHLRVRAEIDGRDLHMVRNGQRALVRAEGIEGPEYSGRVATIGTMLSPGKLSPRGPRRAGDPDVLEVIVALDGETPLLPGTRMDVFFVADPNAPAQEKP